VQRAEGGLRLTKMWNISSGPLAVSTEGRRTGAGGWAFSMDMETTCSQLLGSWEVGPESHLPPRNTWAALKLQAELRIAPIFLNPGVESLRASKTTCINLFSVAITTYLSLGTL
jgi:hypothetical protein